MLLTQQILSILSRAHYSQAKKDKKKTNKASPRDHLETGEGNGGWGGGGGGLVDRVG